MDFQKLLQNKQVLIIAGAVLAVVVVAVILIATLGGGGKSTGSHYDGEGGVDDNRYNAKGSDKIKDRVPLTTETERGKIIEIESLLAQKGIRTEREDDGGSKIRLYLPANTDIKTRDTALLTIVQSGLADANVGLEVFDKGDFTSTKDDKKIRLARAINGELSRLIRKIDPIENASVFISIGNDTMFASMKKPTTATVQLVMPVGEKLSKDKVRAITNLLLGAVSDLEVDNISITDTNGNVYSGLAKADDDTLDKLAENDEYMKTKVQAQLDKLLGKGNYVVTVSTYLREVPMEKSSVTYDPEGKVVVNEQEFNENLGDNNNESGQVSNAVSLYLPSGLPQAANTNQNRNYSRTALEKQYGTSKTQVSEYHKTGIIEDISIAVTIEEGILPEIINLEDLKKLIASAASPKVSADNVRIIFADSARPALAGDKDIELPKPETSGNPWWVPLAIIGIAVIIGWMILSKRVSMAKEAQEEQINTLKTIATQQENKLQEVAQNNQAILNQQGKIQESIQAIREMPVQQIPAQQIQQIPVSQVTKEVQESFEEDEDEVAIQLKNWIESDD